MGNDDDDAAACPDAHDRFTECLLALCIQIGVGFVEDDEERLSIQGTGKGYALALAGGKRCPPSPISVS